MVRGVGTAGACVAAVLLGVGAAQAGPKARAAPADLTGVWTNGWYTDLQRPKEFKALIATPYEAEAYEAPRRRLQGMVVAKDDELGQAEAEFNDKGPGLARIRGEIRSSWIVDPADGKVPYRPEVKEKLGIGKPPVQVYDNVEDRPTMERCLTATGAGAPIINSPDTNFVQIVQTAGAVVIVSEKNHDARVVRLDGPRGPHEPPSWIGVSIGRWEGRTLVVETTGRRPGITRMGVTVSDHTRVVERFTRTGPRELTYLFEVEDPTLFTQRWKAEMVFRASDQPMYEFACHEGNYALPSILSAARQAEASETSSAAGK
jgi:hypothetical protein